MKNKILAVVVTYNRKDMLIKCIQHLLAQTFPFLDILIIDNNSTDGTEQAINSYMCDQIEFIKLPTNIGGAGGFNYGMKEAVLRGYEYCWVMDDDCFADKEALNEFIIADNILKGAYGFLAGTVLWIDGSGCQMNRQKIKKSFYKKIHYLKEGLISVRQSTFVSFFIKTSIIQEVGLPIKEFFIWGDDIEYTRRISAKKECFLVGKSIVVHAMTTNNGSSIATDSADRLARYNYAFRNENFLYRKEGISGVLYYNAKCILNIIRIFRYSRSKRLKRIWIILKNMISGLFFNPKLEFVCFNSEKYDNV